MLSALLAGSVLALAAPPAAQTAAADFAAYETAKADVGRDPDAHVRLALWCEAHGLQAERLKHLAIAVIANPRHSMARGLMGLVEYRGRWQRPESISEKADDDALLAEYRDRRAKTKDDPDAQWTLALWCDENGLKDEAVAHFTAVVKRDPKRDAAWRRLGFKKQGQRWVTDAQLAEEKAEADRQKQADRHWKPLLEKWRDGLDSKSAKRRAEAETGLAEITDPRAVPMLWALFTDDAQRQAVAVRVLGQIDAPGASRGAGDAGRLRRLARGPSDRDRDPQTARPTRVRRPLDRLLARSDQVRGQAGRRPRFTGRDLHRGQAGQRLTTLFPADRSRVPPATGRPARLRRQWAPGHPTLPRGDWPNRLSSPFNDIFFGASSNTVGSFHECRAEASIPECEWPAAASGRPRGGKSAKRSLMRIA